MSPGPFSGIPGIASGDWGTRMFQKGSHKRSARRSTCSQSFGPLWGHWLKNGCRKRPDLTIEKGQSNVSTTASSKRCPIHHIRRILLRVTFIFLKLLGNACRFTRVGHLKSYKRMYASLGSIGPPQSEPGSSVCRESSIPIESMYDA
jgi:hypothetical protein